MVAVFDLGLLGRYYCLILKERLAVVDISEEYCVKLENIRQEFVITIDTTSSSSDFLYIDLFILAQSVEDTDQFPGIVATKIEEEHFEDEGELVLVVELGYPLNGRSSENSKELPCIVATWEQRFLLM